MKLITKSQFNILAEKYTRKTGLPLLALNLEGDILFSRNNCHMCEWFLKKRNTILSKNCRLKMIRAVQEAFRWGEGYITTCPVGLIMFGVPVVSNKKLIGGLLSGFAVFPEMKKDIAEEINENLKKYCGQSAEINMKMAKIKVFSLKKIREHVSFLLELTRKYHVNDLKYLQDRNERYIQQYKIANFLEDLKKSSPDIARKILDKQDEIIQKVKLGDKTGAREILNEFLGSIFFESGMNFEIIKVRVIELIVIISRAAIEAGVEAKELLGLNYSYLTEMSRTTDLEELLVKLTEILENFINKVSSIKEKKKKQRIRKMREFVHQNFSGPLKAKEVARAGGLSVSRTLHLFKEETGLSLSEYIRKLRIDYGKYVLLNTDIPLADVAVESGFFDQSHFTKTFKKMERTTPSQFRKKFRKMGPSMTGAKKEFNITPFSFMDEKRSIL